MSGLENDGIKKLQWEFVKSNWRFKEKVIFNKCLLWGLKNGYKPPFMQHTTAEWCIYITTAEIAIQELPVLRNYVNILHFMWSHFLFVIFAYYLRSDSRQLKFGALPDICDWY